MNTLIEKYYKPIILSGVLLIAILFSASYFFQQGAQKSKASGEVVNLSFEPNVLNSKSATAHIPMTVLQASPSISMSIRGYSMSYAFDKSKLSVSSITYKLGTVSEGLGDSDSTLSTVNSSGIIRIVGESHDPNGIVMQANTKVPVVEITFALVSSDPSSVTLTDNSFGFSKINPDFTLSVIPVISEVLSINGGVAPTSTVTCIPRPACLDATPPCLPPGPAEGWCPEATPTCNPAQEGGKCGLLLSPTPVKGNVTLNLKLKFQGIQKKPIDSLNSMTVKVTAVDESDSSQHEGVGTFTPDDKGIFTGSVSLNVPLQVLQGDSVPQAFKILVKGPQHVQKKVCVATPTETVGGVYQCDKGTISLILGKNDLDFTGIYMLVGDLPQQDGIVNSYDTSLVLNSIGKTDIETLKIADLNRDGIVNFQDFSLVIAALSVRSDEK